MSRKNEDKNREPLPVGNEETQRGNNENNTNTDRSADMEERDPVSRDPSDPMAIREPGKPPSWGLYGNIF